MAKSASALASLLSYAAALRPTLRAPPRRTLISAAAAPPPSSLSPALSTAPPLTNPRHRRRSEWIPPLWAVRRKPSTSPPRSSSSFSSAAAAASVTAAASSNGLSEYDRLLPCPLQSSPPRVEHLVVSEGCNVLNYISRALHLPPLGGGSGDRRQTRRLGSLTMDIAAAAGRAARPAYGLGLAARAEMAGDAAAVVVDSGLGGDGRVRGSNSGRRGGRGDGNGGCG